MSHVSSISSSSYAFHGTLSRLDTNGDGVLSREEVAAGQAPRILGEGTDALGADSSQSSLGNIIAMLMQAPPNGGAANANIPMMPVITPASSSSDHSDLLLATDVYRNTYGQYDTTSAAA